LQSINEVVKTHDRIGKDHTRANGAHDIPNFFLHVRLVAVDLAFTTACFALLEWTTGQAFIAVFK